MNKSCEKNQQHIVKIFYVWMVLYNIKRKNYKTVCAELVFAKSPSTEWSWFCIELVLFFLYLLCSWIIAIFKECLIKSRNSHCLYAHKFYFDAWKLFQKWKELQNVRHIYTVFKFWAQVFVDRTLWCLWLPIPLFFSIDLFFMYTTFCNFLCFSMLYKYVIYMPRVPNLFH